MGFKQQLKRAFKYIVKGVPNNYLTVHTQLPIRNDEGQAYFLITGGSSGISFFA